MIVYFLKEKAVAAEEDSAHCFRHGDDFWETLEKGEKAFLSDELYAKKYDRLDVSFKDNKLTYKYWHPTDPESQKEAHKIQEAVNAGLEWLDFKPLVRSLKINLVENFRMVELSKNISIETIAPKIEGILQKFKNSIPKKSGVFFTVKEWMEMIMVDESLLHLK